MTAVITRPLSDSKDSLLRFAMRLDATLTGLCGLILAASADHIAALSGTTPAQEYLMGAAFVLYGAVVYGLAALPNLRRVGIGVVWANVICTIAAVAVVATDELSLTQFGMIAMLGTGLYTAAFGVLQYLGVRRLA